MTLPASVLRHAGDRSAVTFEPELPVAKREALRHIEMGHAIRVGLWFRSAFWEQLRGERYRDAGFFRSSDQPFAVYWTQFPVRSELLVAWVGGPNASALCGLTREEIIERALSGIGSLFNEPALVRREFEGGAMHDWLSDPFARGAYSYVAAGGGSARARLGEPLDGTLFFAGEATSRNGQGGTVNGALESGERAAREAAEAVGLRAGSPDA